MDRRVDVRRGHVTATPGQGRQHAQTHRGLRFVAAMVLALASVAALSANAVAVPSAKNSTKSQSKTTLATLKVQAAQVTVKKKGESSFVDGKGRAVAPAGRFDQDRHHR